MVLFLYVFMSEQMLHFPLENYSFSYVLRVHTGKCGLDGANGTPRGLPRWCWIPISLNKNSARVGMGSPPTPVLGILAQHGPQGVPPPPFFGRGERGGAI